MITSKPEIVCLALNAFPAKSHIDVRFLILLSFILCLICILNHGAKLMNKKLQGSPYRLISSIFCSRYERSAEYSIFSSLILFLIYASLFFLISFSNAFCSAGIVKYLSAHTFISIIKGNRSTPLGESLYKTLALLSG
ncbi:hypothetical protein JCM10512_1807 [Bacteroides reticulotermitis JCM 10512]|uniref:Uncharacterized protein n=1 Tax=Bacteroides reticulotermitis JCM 10512 TaxID=1445607 RepID=W4URE7_9BACE|nr:hypothetical protein JCM10512_1807 [Bacteroides reticulotermitis JCM 10512]